MITILRNGILAGALLTFASSGCNDASPPSKMDLSTPPADMSPMPIVLLDPNIPATPGEVGMNECLSCKADLGGAQCICMTATLGGKKGDHIITETFQLNTSQIIGKKGKIRLTLQYKCTNCSTSAPFEVSVINGADPSNQTYAFEVPKTDTLDNTRNEPLFTSISAALSIVLSISNGGSVQVGNIAVWFIPQ